MPVQIHKHEDGCKWSGGFLHYLVEAAPDILWYDVQDVGSYQGSVYGVGEYKGQCLIYTDYYGSCSGCGAWGEGGEPSDMEEVLGHCEKFDSEKEALKYLATLDSYNRPNIAAMQQAIEEVFDK